ncbi:hypothetical protein RIB2604_01502940 [Aspergillus luchuensis]|uniref:Uncharacterized protein n=1 Tax=Aspergillus kawachii TaxID=1069201 RepID=A0A146F9N3_ASPKA|nr:hypothetical protein RIB2604_01502940 [Aspergillus luchuensis]
MDHTALKSVLGESDNTSSRICRWQYRLQEYDLDVVHVSGKLMQVADGLSVTMLATTSDEDIEPVLVRLPKMQRHKHLWALTHYSRPIPSMDILALQWKLVILQALSGAAGVDEKYQLDTEEHCPQRYVNIKKEEELKRKKDEVTALEASILAEEADDKLMVDK